MDASQPQRELWMTLDRWTGVQWWCHECRYYGTGHDEVLKDAREHASNTGHEVVISRYDSTRITGPRT